MGNEQSGERIFLKWKAEAEELAQREDIRELAKGDTGLYPKYDPSWAEVDEETARKNEATSYIKYVGWDGVSLAHRAIISLLPARDREQHLREAARREAERQRQEEDRSEKEGV